MTNFYHCHLQQITHFRYIFVVYAIFNTKSTLKPIEKSIFKKIISTYTIVLKKLFSKNKKVNFKKRSSDLCEGNFEILVLPGDKRDGDRDRDSDLYSTPKQN